MSMISQVDVIARSAAHLFANTVLVVESMGDVIGTTITARAVDVGLAPVIGMTSKYGCRMCSLLARRTRSLLSFALTALGHRTVQTFGGKKIMVAQSQIASRGPANHLLISVPFLALIPAIAVEFVT